MFPNKQWESCSFGNLAQQKSNEDLGDRLTPHYRLIHSRTLSSLWTVTHSPHNRLTDGHTLHLVQANRQASSCFKLWYVVMATVYLVDRCELGANRTGVDAATAPLVFEAGW